MQNEINISKCSMIIIIMIINDKIVSKMVSGMRYFTDRRIQNAEAIAILN